MRNGQYVGPENGLPHERSRLSFKWNRYLHNQSLEWMTRKKGERTEMRKEKDSAEALTPWDPLHGSQWPTLNTWLSFTADTTIFTTKTPQIRFFIVHKMCTISNITPSPETLQENKWLLEVYTFNSQPTSFEYISMKNYRNTRSNLSNLCSASWRISFKLLAKLLVPLWWLNRRMAVKDDLQ